MDVDFLYNDGTITYPQSIRGASFSSLASFLMGTYNNGGYTQNFGTPTTEQTNPNLGIYAQDDSTVYPGLTLNLGVRYALQFVQTIMTDTNQLLAARRLRLVALWNERTWCVAAMVSSTTASRCDRWRMPFCRLTTPRTTIQANLLSYTCRPPKQVHPPFRRLRRLLLQALENFSTMQSDIQNPYSQQIRLGVELVFNAMLTSSTKAKSSFAGHLTHGWRAGRILQYYSRLPFDIVTGGKTLQQTAQRPCAAGPRTASWGLRAQRGTPPNPCMEGLAGEVIGKESRYRRRFL